MSKRFTRITATETAEEQKRHDAVRRQVKAEFPPKQSNVDPEAGPQGDGIGGQLRAARTAKGLTWYAVAKLAGIPNSGTVRDIEEGRDAKLSSVEAIASVLGLHLTAVKPNQRRR